MNIKILITGPPRSGKSTLITKLIEYYKKEKEYIIYGFLTPEIRENGNRIGFDVVDIHTGKSSQLARIGDFKTKYKVGKYYVFVKEFERYIYDTLNFEGKSIDLFVIDEIGKMELFSIKFQNFIKKIFSFEKPILATLGLKVNHPLKNYLINVPSVKVLNLNKQNFQSVFEKVRSLIS